MFEKIQNLFVFLAIIFGLSFLALIPPFQVPDEMTHFLRSYQVAEGGWISVKKGALSGGELPTGLWQIYRDFSDLPGHRDRKVRLSFADYRDRFGQTLDRSRREFVGFPNTSNYSALVYLPQAAGIYLGNVFGGSALTLFYLGRLANLLAWIALIYWAIRSAAFFPCVLLVSAMLPMSLQQAASLSADALVNGTCTLYVVLCMKHALLRDKRIEGRELALLAILSLAVALMKQAYLPLVLMVWLIPSSRFSGRGSRILFASLVSLGALLAFGAWAYVVTQVAVPMRAEAQPLHQLQSLLRHPLDFLALTARTYVANSLGYLEQFLGQLGWLDVVLPRSLIGLLAASLLATSLLDQNPELDIPWRLKISYLGIALLCLLSLSMAIWVTWTPPGAALIDGIQGRYFIPFALLGLVFFYNRNIRFRRKADHLRWMALATVSVPLCWTMAVLFERYYG
jgi:uncharacterized membrane protein